MTRLALAIGIWIVAAVARADVPPPPTRPDWPDTPLPMPTDPFVLVLLGAVLVIAASRVLRVRR